MNNEIKYTIRKSKRAKRIRITVRRDCKVVVTIPPRATKKIAMGFVSEKKEWILDKLKKYSKFKNTAFASLTKRDYLKYKEKARDLAHNRIEYFSALYGLSYNKIAIRDQKSRWGSCSSKKNLNFNYKIVFLTKEQCDYVIVHEVCHLKELNHSERFWNLVEQTTPNHKTLRKELRNIL